MSIKEISEAMQKKNVYFGLKQTLKNIKNSKSKKLRVFVANDARQETITKLEESGIEFSKVKCVEDSAKELGLDFECEVFLVK